MSTTNVSPEPSRRTVKVAALRQELSPEQLRRTVDPATFHFQNTGELPPLENVIGQERAMRSVSFSIGMPSHDYHLFALGPSGTGKITSIRQHLQGPASTRPAPDDWCYVNNFDNPDQPRALRLPAGQGCRLRQDMDRFIDELKKQVPLAFESEQYQQEQSRIQEEFEKRNQQLFQSIESTVQANGFTLVRTIQGLVLAPMVKGKVVTPEQFDQLDQPTRQHIEEQQGQVQEQLRESMHQVEQLQKEAQERIRDLDRQAVGFALDRLMRDMQKQYAQIPAVADFLQRVRQDVLENVQAFKTQPQAQAQADQQQQLPFLLAQANQQAAYERYRVNQVVDNCNIKCAPVIEESNPTYHNLVGRVEHQAQFGALVTNFTMIKGGALHSANGGYLMVRARDLLTKPFAWEALKRSLRDRQVTIEPMGQEYQVIPTRTLEPEPIPLDVKVILVGDPMIYYLLYQMDDEFRELFKVKADFAVETDWNDNTTEEYAQFIGNLCREEGLRQFDPSGAARIVEYGGRLAESQRKVLVKFSDVADLIHQSSYWAGQNGHELVTAGDVEQAIAEKVYRSDMIEERVREMIEDGTILIDTAGEVTGQVNGIAVVPLGDYAFGRPSRITARSYAGSAGVVNIDRENSLGGPIHNKGVMIIAGYLGGQYARDVPLALSATITFEQMYEGVEGDSASSAELYALLSSLADAPIQQSLAVTGSVNQRGQVQAIGGVNEKIEGFFKVCKVKGLNGRQGVLIPESNVKHLMLHEEVVEAVRQGQFHIYPVSTIDEGIAVLTGVPAGERQPDGTYPEGTINGIVQRRLLDLAEKSKEYARPERQEARENRELEKKETRESQNPNI